MEKLIIVDKGMTDYSIVIHNEASEAVKYAAKELQDYLLAITAMNIPITDKIIGEKNIIITHGELCDEDELNAWKAVEGQDGYYLKTKGDNILIIGDTRGVIYAVYELLEKLGCRFFTATCEKIPSYEQLYINKLDEWYVPPLEYREHLHQSSAESIRYALKSRLNGNNTKIPQELGGKYEYAWFCHSFDLICDPEEYYEEHPEYFSEVEAYELDNTIIESYLNEISNVDKAKADMARKKIATKKDNYYPKSLLESVIGEIPDYFPKSGQFRLRDDTQLCLSNPEVIDMAIQSVRECLHKNPHAKIISVSQNDVGNPCQCEKCKAIDEREGSHAGSLIMFVNKVAEAIEEEYPDVLIDTFAYLYSRNAPKYIKPRHNVCVRLCSIECCFSHPFGECDQSLELSTPGKEKNSFVKDVEDWSKICEHLYIWDYVANFSHYCMPHPNWNVLKPNIKFLVDNGVKGIMEQGNYCIDHGADLNDLRAYVIGKLLWNPNDDEKVHMDEFIDYYYGEGAEYIKKYLKLMLDKVEQDNIHISFCNGPDKEFLSFEMLDKYDKIFEEALKATNNNPIYYFRIARANLPVRYVRLKMNSMQGKVDKTKIDEFFKDCQAHGIVRVEEWVNLPRSRRAFYEGVWSGGSYMGDFRSQADVCY